VRVFVCGVPWRCHRNHFLLTNCRTVLTSFPARQSVFSQAFSLECADTARTSSWISASAYPARSRWLGRAVRERAAEPATDVGVSESSMGKPRNGRGRFARERHRPRADSTRPVADRRSLVRHSGWDSWECRAGRISQSRRRSASRAASPRAGPRARCDCGRGPRWWQTAGRPASPSDRRPCRDGGNMRSLDTPTMMAPSAVAKTQ